MKIRNAVKIQPFITKDGSEIREIFHPNNSPIKGMSFADAPLLHSATTLKKT